MVEVVQKAARCLEHWKAEFGRLRKRIGKKKGRVAIARKMLVAVWYVLTKGEADRFATPQQVAGSFFAVAYKLGVRNLPDGMSALQYTRRRLDNLEIGQEWWRIRLLTCPEPNRRAAGRCCGRWLLLARRPLRKVVLAGQMHFASRK